MFEALCLNGARGRLWQRPRRSAQIFKNGLVAQLNGTAGGQPPAISSFLIFLSFHAMIALVVKAALTIYIEQETCSRA